MNGSPIAGAETAFDSWLCEHMLRTYVGYGKRELIDKVGARRLANVDEHLALGDENGRTFLAATR